MEAYAGKQYVGVDLHRRRTVIVRTTEAGEVLETVRIVNDVERLASVMARAGQCPEVVLEATYGWSWAVDAVQAGGANSLEISRNGALGTALFVTEKWHRERPQSVLCRLS